MPTSFRRPLLHSTYLVVFWPPIIPSLRKRCSLAVAAHHRGRPPRRSRRREMTMTTSERSGPLPIRPH